MGHELKISAGVTLSSVEQNEDAKGGLRTTYRFLGSRADCQVQRLTERARGAKTISLQPQGDGMWELVSSYPYDAESGGGVDVDQPTDTHELEVNMAQQDVWLNPKLQGALTEALMQKLVGLVRDWKNGKHKNAAAAIAECNSATGNNTTALDYFKLIAFKGVENWMFYRTVYSRTITAATPGQVRASFEGAQKIWTTAQILAWEGLPNDWWFQLPNYVWHKSPPRVSTNIGTSSKTNINYNYIASDEVSPLLYDNY